MPGSGSGAPGDALMIREAFAAAGAASRFHVLPGGDQALRFLRRDGRYAAAPRPALILLDLDLPGLPGLDVLAQIKADPVLAIIPVIVLSGSRDPDSVTRAYARHANAYITKPADLDAYDEMVKQIHGCFLSLITLPPAPPTTGGQGRPDGTAGPRPRGG